MKDETAVEQTMAYEDIEYAAFVWNIKRGEYQMVGRPMGTLRLVKERVAERMRDGLIDGYDTKRIIYKKRIVKICLKEWEDINLKEVL